MAIFSDSLFQANMGTQFETPMSLCTWQAGAGGRLCVHEPLVHGELPSRLRWTGRF